MTVLVVGVGNVFFGDDAFGVEVARQLAPSPPPGARVADFGIRAIHLAYELLAPVELCIIADCMARGGEPGTLYVLEPEVDELASPGVAGARSSREACAEVQAAVADAHAMNLPVVFSAVRELGGRLPRTLVVGCEPAAIEPGIGLSDPVARAVPEALSLIRELVTQSQEDHHDQEDA